MAVISPYSSCRKGKASAEAPSQLEQHLPKSAQALVSPLSDDDREILLYMLTFGLHLFAGFVLPVSMLQWRAWKGSSVKVGVKRDHAFPSHSLQSVSGKFRSGPQKAPSLFAHKPSCSCYCFSCYSSFWSRWAASPNRDLLNMIIEISETADVEEEQKVSKGKEKKKRIVGQEAGGKKTKGGKWKLHTSPKTFATAPSSFNQVEIISSTEIANDASGCTSMDVMYDALWDSVSKDEAPQLVARSIDGSVMAAEHATQALSPAGLLFAPMQGKDNLKSQRVGKHKSNQIIPLVFEATFVLAKEGQESHVSNEKAEGSLCSRVADANLRGKGFLSCIFPDALSGIASRLWDLVSIGSAGNYSMD